MTDYIKPRHLVEAKFKEIAEKYCTAKLPEILYLTKIIDDAVHECIINTYRYLGIQFTDIQSLLSEEEKDLYDKKHVDISVLPDDPSRPSYLKLDNKISNDNKTVFISYDAHKYLEKNDDAKIGIIPISILLNPLTKNQFRHHINVYSAKTVLDNCVENHKDGKPYWIFYFEDAVIDSYIYYGYEKHKSFYEANKKIMVISKLLAELPKDCLSRKGYSKSRTNEEKYNDLIRFINKIENIRSTFYD